MTRSKKKAALPVIPTGGRTDKTTTDRFGMWKIESREGKTKNGESTTFVNVKPAEQHPGIGWRDSLSVPMIGAMVAEALDVGPEKFIAQLERVYRAGFALRYPDES